MQDKSNAEERYQFIAEHLGYGKSIRQEYREKFHLGEAQFYADRKHVLQEMKDRLDGNLEDWAKDLVERYEELYERALNRNAIKEANKILDSLRQLKGLDTRTLEVKTDNQIELQWNVGESEPEGNE